MMRSHNRPGSGQELEALHLTVVVVQGIQKGLGRDVTHQAVLDKTPREVQAECPGRRKKRPIIV